MKVLSREQTGDVVLSEGFHPSSEGRRHHFQSPLFPSPLSFLLFFLHKSHQSLFAVSFHRSGLKVPRHIYSTTQVQGPQKWSPFLIITFVVRYSLEFLRSFSRHKGNLARQQEQMAFLCERRRKDQTRFMHLQTADPGAASCA